MIPLTVTNGTMPIIMATRREFIAALDDFVFCHACESDESAFSDMYYVPATDCIFCENCLQLYAKGAVSWQVDAKENTKRFLKMKSKFDDLGVWE